MRTTFNEAEKNTVDNICHYVKSLSSEQQTRTVIWIYFSSKVFRG